MIVQCLITQNYELTLENADTDWTGVVLTGEGLAPAPDPNVMLLIAPTTPGTTRYRITGLVGAVAKELEVELQTFAAAGIAPPSIVNGLAVSK